MFDEGDNVVTLALNGAQADENEVMERRRRIYSIDSYNGWTTLRQWTGGTRCSSLKGVTEGVLYPKYVSVQVTVSPSPDTVSSGKRTRRCEFETIAGFNYIVPKSTKKYSDKPNYFYGCHTAVKLFCCYRNTTAL
jgi:hypothetical protein